MKRTLITCLVLLGACADDNDAYNLDAEPAPEEVEREADPLLAVDLERVVDADVERGRCGTAHTEAPELPGTLDADDRAPQVTIGVAFHVIRARIGGQMRGDISADRIRRQIRVMNEAFASTRFRFDLRVVTRTTNERWFRMAKDSADERAAKRALHRGGDTMLNIYTIGPNRVLGWATFPWDHEDAQDGVVVQFATTPSGPGRFTLGDTAVHETGHWLGLFHTFGLLSNGCESGDAVDDTPEERTPAFGCPTGRNSCPEPGADPIHNFMDYTDDACMNRFSPDQAQKMSSAWTVHRD